MSLAENVNAYVNFLRMCADIHTARGFFGKEEQDRKLDKFHAKVLQALESSIMQDINRIEIDKMVEQDILFALNVIAYCLIATIPSFDGDTLTEIGGKLMERIKGHESIQS